MYRLILSSVVALFVAGQAHSQTLTWPTICAPTIPEQCATIAPGASFSTGGTIYDPATGYRAPDAVVIAWATQGDALNALGYAWGLYHNGLVGMTLEQTNQIVWVAASIGDRDSLYGTHQRWAPQYAWVFPDQYAASRCGPQPSARCKAAFKFAAVTEYTSNGIATDQPGLSYAQLEAIFQIALGQ